jgi:2-C-methyl-D-erythritol 4-phosphate cytidylyltransferase
MPEPAYPQLGVVITAGGSSTRFGGNKLVADLKGTRVLERSIRAYVGLAGEIVVATGVSADEELSTIVRAFADEPSVRFVAAGGATRAHTVRNALDSLTSEWVAVHDGARPLVSRALIDRVMAAALATGAAAPAMPVSLTIKRSETALPALVHETVPRAALWAMQTPQMMRRADLLDAYARCPVALKDVTDDVQLLELVGKPVMLVAGDEQNLKITTPMDLRIAEWFLDAR